MRIPLWFPSLLALACGGLSGLTPTGAQSPSACPYLTAADLRALLGSNVSERVLEADPDLEGASSCRFQSATTPLRSVVVAELGVATVVGDPFAALRPHALAPLEVPGVDHSILVLSATLDPVDAWYSGFADRQGVVLLWADADGFQSALGLDAADLPAEAQHRELSRLAQRLVSSR